MLVREDSCQIVLVLFIVPTLAYFDVPHSPNLIHHFQPTGKMSNGTWKHRTENCFTFHLGGKIAILRNIKTSFILFWHCRVQLLCLEWDLNRAPSTHCPLSYRVNGDDASSNPARGNEFIVVLCNVRITWN